jgi:hypothetical protein
MKVPSTVHALEDFGRIRLSKSFFMRDFLYSEISQIEGIPNIPTDLLLAEEVGRQLCQNVLEPIQDKFGRISIRSAYRSSAVNARGAENNNQYKCAMNKTNFARHIWDERDAQNGGKGAMVCIVVNSFIPYYERTKNWSALAWWIHDHVPAYSEMEFFPTFAAFNISYHENPIKKITSVFQPKKGILTRPGMPNFDGSHEAEYEEFLSEFTKA